MYSKKDIEKTLLEYNYFIDESTLDSFIKDWKIEAIYEDEDGVEFFDNLAISKLKKGISLKSQGYTNDQIIYHVNKLLPEKLGLQKETEAKKPKEEQPEQEKQELEMPSESKSFPILDTKTGKELKNVTLDVTHQTLQMLANALAEKITTDIKNSDFIAELIHDTSLKKDNEVLSQRVEELTEDNKKLAQRIEELEQKKGSFFHFIKNIFS